MSSSASPRDQLVVRAERAAPDRQGLVSRLAGRVSETLSAARQALVDLATDGPLVEEHISRVLQDTRPRLTDDLADGERRGVESAVAGAVAAWELDIVPDDTVTRTRAGEVRYIAERDSAAITTRLARDTSQAVAQTRRVGAERTAREAVEETFSHAEGYGARRIADTTLADAFNRGRSWAFLDAPDVRRTMWVTVGDNRVRPTHAAAEGQIVQPGEMFVVGGHFAPFPGAAMLPAGERVNCRCSAVPYD